MDTNDVTANHGIISQPSPYSVTETIDRLVAILQTKGIPIFALLRALMLQSSQQNGIESLQLSVQSARQLLLSFIPQLIYADVLQHQDRYQLILILLWEQRLPQRPHRSEPRVVKRLIPIRLRLHAAC
ncbi:MAG TPA: hypothetical protein V6C57_15680 [Coleofasciculaceae cyanobacterium]